MSDTADSNKEKYLERQTLLNLPGQRMLDLIILARPKHWVKNVFVLMPVPFALVSGAEPVISIFLLGFFGFCLINSAIYVFNDVLDVQADRLHPKKKHRPIANGRIPIPLATIWGAMLALGGIGLGWATGIFNVLLLTFMYLVANLFYSAKGKHLALVDIFILTSGFVIRVVLGCALLSVTPSNWLLLCTSSLALFLGLAKRRSDLVDGMTSDHRQSLTGYNVDFLEHAITLSAGLALSYSLYSVESTVLVSGRELACLPFVAYGLLFYLREVHVSDSGGSPVEIALRSRTVWACMTGWAYAATWSVGLW